MIHNIHPFNFTGRIFINVIALPTVPPAFFADRRALNSLFEDWYIIFKIRSRNLITPLDESSVIKIENRDSNADSNPRHISDDLHVSTRANIPLLARADFILHISF
jgi:hypothetical protein